MSIYRGPISDAFHVARDAALRAVADKFPAISQSDLDACDDAPYIMFMFRSAKDQRHATESGVVALLQEVVLSELGQFPCVSHLISKLDIRIRNEEDNRDETWLALR